MATHNATLTEADYDSWKKARAAEKLGLPATPLNDRQPIPDSIEQKIDDYLRGSAYDVILSNFHEKRAQLIELRMLLHQFNFAETKFQNWFQVLDGCYAHQDVQLSSGSGNLVPYALGDIGHVIKIITTEQGTSVSSKGIANDEISASSGNRMSNPGGDEMNSDSNLQEVLGSKTTAVTDPRRRDTREHVQDTKSSWKKSRVLKLRPRDPSGRVIPVKSGSKDRVGTLRPRDTMGKVIQGAESESKELGVNIRSSLAKGVADVTSVKKPGAKSRKPGNPQSDSGNEATATEKKYGPKSRKPTSTQTVTDNEAAANLKKHVQRAKKTSQATKKNRIQGIIPKAAVPRAKKTNQETKKNRSRGLIPKAAGTKSRKPRNSQTNKEAASTPLEKEGTKSREPDNEAASTPLEKEGISPSSPQRMRMMELEENNGNPIIDESTVIPAVDLKQQIEDKMQGDLVSKRRKLPITAVDMWKYDRMHQKDIFSTQLVDGGFDHSWLIANPPARGGSDTYSPAHGGSDTYSPARGGTYSPARGPKEHEIGGDQCTHGGSDTYSPARGGTYSPACGPEEHEIGGDQCAHVENTSDNDMFIGWERHGVKLRKDINAEELRYYAAVDWLHVPLYLCILLNHMHFDTTDGYERRLEVGVATSAEDLFKKSCKKSWKIAHGTQEVKTMIPGTSGNFVMYMTEYRYTDKDRGRVYFARVYVKPDESSRYVIHTICDQSCPYVLSQNLASEVIRVKDKIGDACKKKAL